jgi:hypothetical protein
VLFIRKLEGRFQRYLPTEKLKIIIVAHGSKKNVWKSRAAALTTSFPSLSAVDSFTVLSSRCELGSDEVPSGGKK